MQTEDWKILQVMRVSADFRLHTAPQYSGNIITVRNSLELSNAVCDAIKISLANLIGGLAGGGSGIGAVRTYTGTVPGTADAIIVTLQKIGETS